MTDPLKCPACGHLLSSQPSRRVFVNVSSGMLSVDGNVVVKRLTIKESRLLEALVQAMPNILTRDQLIDHVYGVNFAATDRLIDSCVKRIRPRLKGTPVMISTRHSVGYFLELRA